MNRISNSKYLWAFIGCSFFTGLLTSFVVIPVFEKLAQITGARFDRALLVVNLIIGFFVFRYFVWYFIARTPKAVYSDPKTTGTEQAGSGNGSTRT